MSLLFELSKLKQEEKIKELFVKKINDLHPTFSIKFIDRTDLNKNEVIELLSTRKNFGTIQLTGNPADISKDFYSILKNAVDMITEMLEKSYQDEILSNENLVLENEQLTAELTKNTKDYKSTLNNLLTGVVVHSSDTTVIYSNIVARDLWVYPNLSTNFLSFSLTVTTLTVKSYP